jgi:hypothetical protein
MATRGVIKVERGGSSRRRGSMLPRLARWAGVGVFVFGGIFVGCEEESPPAPVADNGYVWVAPSYCHIDFLKIGNNSGAVVQTLDLGKEAIPCLRMVAGPETGNLYIFAGGSLEKYDREGKLLYSFDMGREEDFEVDEGHDALWTYDWFYLSLWSAATGEPVGGVKYEPDKVTDFRVSASDGGIWLGGTSDEGVIKVVVKYSKGLKKERVIALEGKPEHIAVNGSNGELWAAWSKKDATGEMRRFISRYSAEGRHYCDILLENRTKGMVVNEYTGGCFVKFREAIAEYSAEGKFIASWRITELRAFTADPGTGDLYAMSFNKPPAFVLRKIDGGLKKVIWRANLGYVDGEYLNYCLK